MLADEHHAPASRPAPSWERDVDVVVVGSGAAGLAAALAVRPVRSAADRHQGDARRRLDGLGAGRPRRRARPHRLAGEPRPRHARRRRRAVRRGGRARARRRGADGDPLPDAPRRGLRSRRHTTATNRRWAARAGTATTASSTPAATAAAPRCSERSTSRPSPPVSRCSSGRSPSTSSSGRRSTGRARRPASASPCSMPTAPWRPSASCGPAPLCWRPGATGRCSPPRRTRRRSPATGSPIAMRAGLDVSDVEFVQFHPTVMWSGPDAAGQQALVSEAVRGEGAILYDGAGGRVMAGVHPQEDLAPRDVVAAAISRTDGGGAGRCRRPRLPRRHGDGRALLRALPVDHRGVPRRSASTRRATASRWPRLPTTPAAACRRGSTGRRRCAGLYAVGEVSCTGVHGANRLASNSLTESVVAGTRLGRDLAWELPGRGRRR